MPRPKQKDLFYISLRLRKKDVRQARAFAKDLGIPYQHVLRSWVARGAAIQQASVSDGDFSGTMGI